MSSARALHQRMRAPDVVSALECERTLARIAGATFEVTTVHPTNGLPLLTIRAVRGEVTAEEVDALDGLQVHWIGMPVGARPRVSVVSAEQGTIRLRGYFTGPTPEAGTQIRTMEIDFYGPIIDLWQRPRLGEIFLAQLKRFTQEAPIRSLGLDTHDLSKSLFPEQAKALGLPDFDITFIWGTGGAGKTMTISTVVRAYMSMYPAARILICTTSNKGLDEIVLRIAEGSAGSFRLKRYGQAYDKEKFTNCPDLLPGTDDLLHVGARPEYPFDEEEVTLPGGVYAFTTVGAVYRFDKLAEHTWDLLIADEASQISLSSALPIMSLADSVVFVGDPEQCSPVAKTNNELWLSIVGASAFEFIPPEGNRMVMLARQARMPYIVGAWSGREFYNDKLQLSQEVSDTLEWQAFRQRSFRRFSRDEHFAIVEIPNVGAGPKEQCIREYSARRAVELILEDNHHEFDWMEIAYVTPFNGQANLFKQLMRDAKLHSVTSSTAHKLQGGQFPIVLLDPVHATGTFMRSTIGRQILNVGATRTQCKLIWLVSEEDLTNPWLTKLREFSASTNQLLGR